MKKYVSVLLAVLMIFTMSALLSCGREAPANALEMIEEANGNLKQNGADVRISLNATTKASAVDVTVSAKITVQVSGISDGRISRDTEAYVYADFGDLGGLTALAGGKTESTFVEIALSGGILYMRSRLPSYEEAETQAFKADISGYFGVINEAIDKYSSGDFADGSDTTESLSAVSSVIDGIRERLPTPVFWPGELHGLYSPWGHKESDMTEGLSLTSWINPLIIM